jgi:MoxR-like ATPase
VQDIVPDILRHRLVLSYDALADDVPADHVIARIMQTVPMPSVASRQGTSPNGHQPAPTSGVPAAPFDAAGHPPAPQRSTGLWPGQR